MPNLLAFIKTGNVKTDNIKTANIETGDITFSRSALPRGAAGIDFADNKVECRDDYLRKPYKRVKNSTASGELSISPSLSSMLMRVSSCVSSAKIK